MPRGRSQLRRRSRHCRQLWRLRGPGHGRAKRERPCALPAHKRAGTLPCCAESSCARSASDYAARAAKARTAVRCSAGDRRTWTDLSSGGVWRRKMTTGQYGLFTALSHSQTVKLNILIAAVFGGKETRFYNGTGHISELAVSTSKYHVCLMSHDKIPHFFIV